MKSILSIILGYILKFFLFILRPFIKIRIGLVPYRSLGRISGNMEYYFRSQMSENNSRKEVHILVSGSNPVNSQIMKMIKRRALVLESNFLWECLDGMQGTLHDPTGRQAAPEYQNSIWINLRHSGFLLEWDTWQNIGPQLTFTDEEHSEGKKLLKELGIPEGSEYVCIHARDKAYTDSPDYTRSINDSLAFNDFRDCGIDSYLPAAKWLTEKGLWVVRVGHQVVGPIRKEHSMIIDYASDYRRHLHNPDFADAYLQAHCKFLIGCTAGIYYLSHIFDVPIAFVNMAPLAESGRCKNDLWIVKKYWNTKENRYMTFSEMVERGADWNRLWYDEQKKILDEGISILDNTPEEILALTQEMYARLDGTWNPKPEDKNLQRRFRQIFPDGHPMVNFPGYVGSDFLNKNLKLLK